MDAFNKKGYQAQRLPVSHAFHTKIVAPAAGPLRQVLDRFDVRPPRLPLVSNVTADFYPSEPGAIKDLLCRQIASPVRWVEGVQRLYAAGARAFVEVGPKRALKGFVDDVLSDKTDVMSLFTNRPRPKEVASFNQALAGLYAAGYGAREAAAVSVSTVPVVRRESAPAPGAPAPASGTLDELRALLQKTLASLPAATAVRAEGPYDRNEVPLGSIVISGTGLGLPGADKPVMDPKNAARILAGEQFIGPVPQRHREGMARRRITQLVKTADGSGHFQVIDDPKDVIKLAGRAGSFDLSAEYGVPEKLVEALDSDDPARDGRGARRAARGGDPPRPDLEEDHHRQVPARAVDAAGGDARGDGRRLRERLPRLQPLRRRGAALLHVREPAGAEAAARGAAGDDAGVGHPVGDLAADRGDRRAPREGALRVRPALPAAHPHDGPQPVRRVHRRPRAQHPRQRGLRLDGVRHRPRRGLDPARAAAGAWSWWPPTTSRATR